MPYLSVFCQTVHPHAPASLAWLPNQGGATPGMSVAVNPPFPALRRTLAKPVLRGGIGMSLGVHALLLAALLWRWQSPQPNPSPPETTLQVVFEPPAETIQNLPPATLTPAPAQPRDLTPPQALTLPARQETAPLHRPTASRAQPHPANTSAAAEANTPAQPPPLPSTPTQPSPDPAAIGAFEAKVQSAVQEAASYPAIARMQHRQGRARVRFTYADGHEMDAALVVSSNSAALDHAALAAVQRATLPAPPTQIAARRLDMMVWVSFTLTSATE